MSGRHGAAVLRGSGIRYVRDGRTILDDADIEVAAGEAVAVMGPSGSGKSTLLVILAGLERPDAGEVERPDLARALILQGYGLVGLLTAAENVEIALQASDAGADRAAIRDRAHAALASVGIDGAADQLVEELSGGQQQRVAVARALAVQPRMLFADEFTAELDATTATRVLDLVLAIARAGGIVLLATHDPEIAARCDRIVRLRHD